VGTLYIFIAIFILKSKLRKFKEAVPRKDLGILPRITIDLTEGLCKYEKIRPSQGLRNRSSVLQPHMEAQERIIIKRLCHKIHQLNNFADCHNYSFLNMIYFAEGEILDESKDK
jgi:hypothetical protein